MKNVKWQPCMSSLNEFLHRLGQGQWGITLFQCPVYPAGQLALRVLLSPHTFPCQAALEHSSGGAPWQQHQQTSGLGEEQHPPFTCLLPCPACQWIQPLLRVRGTIMNGSDTSSLCELSNAPWAHREVVWLPGTTILGQRLCKIPTLLETSIAILLLPCPGVQEKDKQGWKAFKTGAKGS